jgi:hypothetical protein
MSFSKKTYTSGQTPITADNLNAIQDELIRLGGAGTSPVSDYVVAQGTSGIWTYRKWNSGLSECFGGLNVSPSGPNTEGSLYFKGVSVAYPTGLFLEKPYATGGVMADWICGITQACSSSTKDTFYGYLWVAHSTAMNGNYSFMIKLHVTGRWK